MTLYSPPICERVSMQAARRTVETRCGPRRHVTRTCGILRTFYDVMDAVKLASVVPAAGGRRQRPS